MPCPQSPSRLQKFKNAVFFSAWPSAHTNPSRKWSFRKHCSNRRNLKTLTLRFNQCGRKTFRKRSSLKTMATTTRCATIITWFLFPEAQIQNDRCLEGNIRYVLECNVCYITDFFFAKFVAQFSFIACQKAVFRGFKIVLSIFNQREDILKHMVNATNEVNYCCTLQKWNLQTTMKWIVYLENRRPYN